MASTTSPGFGPRPACVDAGRRVVSVHCARMGEKEHSVCEFVPHLQPAEEEHAAVGGGHLERAPPGEPGVGESSTRVRRRGDGRLRHRREGTGLGVTPSTLPSTCTSGNSSCAKAKGRCNRVRHKPCVSVRSRGWRGGKVRPEAQSELGARLDGVRQGYEAVHLVGVVLHQHLVGRRNPRG